MALSAQRAAFLTAHVESVHRNLRLLEHVVTGPIGLTTDLKSLREAVPSPLAGEERERVAFQDWAAGRSPRDAGLAAQRLASGAMELIAAAAPDGSDPLSSDWRYRATKVLDRVAERLGADARRDAAGAMAGVYVIVDPEHTNGRPVAQVAEAALRGGATAIQYRDKTSDKGVVLATAKLLAALCSKAGAVLIVNDYADIALLAGAGGLHVGQRDIPVREARRVLAPGQLIGKSNALVQEALEAEAEGADYVAVGAIFDTSTKPDTRPAGLETLRLVKRSVAAPVVAIGGIDEGNVGLVAEAGADVVCVATAVTRADDPESAARRLTEAFQSARKK